MTVFKNFKIKGWAVNIQNYAFNYTNFERLLNKALGLCFFQFNPDGGSIVGLPAKKKLKELEEKINRFAQLGFTNKKNMDLALRMSEHLGGAEIEFDDLPIREWALYGKQILNSNELKESQIIAFSVLKEIDKVLSTLSDNKSLNLKTLERVISIGLEIHSAYEIEYHCYNPAIINNAVDIQKIKESSIENYIEELRVKKSERAAEYAKIRHQEDPKQAEKTFIFDCWNDWKAGKSVYKNQTAFAKDMLTKVEHLESQKVIETWCTEWNKRKLA